MVGKEGVKIGAQFCKKETLIDHFFCERFATNDNFFYKVSKNEKFKNEKKSNFLTTINKITKNVKS